MKTHTHTYRLHSALLVIIAFLLLACSSGQNIGHNNGAEYSPESGGRSGGIDERIAQDYFVRGAVLQMQERYAEAILEYQQALRTKPAAGIHFALADCYMQLSKMEQAEEHLRNSLALNPGHLPSRELKAQFFLQNLALDSAVAAYEYLAQHKPHSLSTRLTLARLYEFTQPDKALNLYLTILGENTGYTLDDDYAIMQRLEDLYRKQADTTRRLEILEKMYTISPGEYYLPYTLMDLYVGQRNFAKAEKLLKHIDYSVPAEEVFYYYVQYAGTMHEVFAQSDTLKPYALRYLKHADSNLGGHWIPMYYAGLLAAELEDSAARNRYFERCLSLADTSAEVPTRIALHYYGKENFPAMAAVLEQYRDSFPDKRELPFLLGLAYFRQDLYEQAIAALHTAIARDSAYVEAWIQLGIVYSMADNMVESDAAYERALELAPDDPLLNNNYAYSLSERGLQLDRARTMTEKALAADPENSSYLDTMGWILYQLGDYEQALRYTQRSIDFDKGSAVVYEHLGDIYIKLGQRDKAEKAWQLALELDPDSESTKERLGLLGEPGN